MILQLTFLIFSLLTLYRHEILLIYSLITSLLLFHTFQLLFPDVFSIYLIKLRYLLNYLLKKYNFNLLLAVSIIWENDYWSYGQKVVKNTVIHTEIQVKTMQFSSPQSATFICLFTDFLVILKHNTKNIKHFWLAEKNPVKIVYVKDEILTYKLARVYL